MGQVQGRSAGAAVAAVGPALVAVLAALAAVALSGCSLALKLPSPPGVAAARAARIAAGAGAGAGAGARTGAGRAPGAVPAVTHNEVPTPPGPQERTAAAAATAPAAVRSFAERYINWTASDVAAHLRQLAADSVGQARSAMALAARQTGADPELAEAGVANHGVVEAVAVLDGSGGQRVSGGHSGSGARRGSGGQRGSGDRWVVVTRESTTATDSTAYQGLAPAWHLAVATVVRRRGGWVVSGWQPEN
jgi:hypothetical protein